jgi:hypothetical protein
MSGRLALLFQLNTSRRSLRHKRLKGLSTPEHEAREEDLTDRLITGLIEALRDVSQQAQSATTAVRRRGLG